MASLLRGAALAKSTKALSAISQTDVSGSADFHKFARRYLIRDKGSGVLDKSKIPSDLLVHRVWVTEGDSETRRPIAYVSDRRRRIVGAVLIVFGVILALAVLVTRVTFWLAFVALLIAWGGTAYAGGGQTGFYEVDEVGGLGKYLGRSKPDFSSMRAVK